MKQPRRRVIFNAIITDNHSYLNMKYVIYIYRNRNKKNRYVQQVSITNRYVYIGNIIYV